MPDNYIVLSNHVTDYDPILVALSFPKQMYFVASEHLLRKGIASKLLMHFIKPIIHMKGRQGAKTVKQMLRTLQEGNSVCIFPEGNRSFNGVTMEMQASIAKVAKKAKVISALGIYYVANYSIYDNFSFDDISCCSFNICDYCFFFFQKGI